MATELNVELRDIIAQKNVIVGGKSTVVDVETDQYSIMVNGSEIGLVCKAAGCPVNFLPIANNYPLDARNKIAEAVKVRLAELEQKPAEQVMVERKTYQPPSQESVDAASEMIARAEARENSVEEDENNL